MPVERVLEELDQAAAAVRRAFAVEGGAPLARIGVVLGSGLGGWAGELAASTSLPYADIPHMPVSAVAGHAGNLWRGRLGDESMLCLQGRVHLYEGHAPDKVVFGVRLLARLGCRVVLLTNAAGGLAKGMVPGDLMLIRDHLNLTGKNPLVGANLPELGPRFPDMSRAYDPDLCTMAHAAAKAAGVTLHEGIYAAMLGPSYETPAEVNMARILGASAVGMSTVPEVIALRHMGVRCGAISCITNLAAGTTDAVLDHAEVEETARRTRTTFAAVLGGFATRAAVLAQKLPDHDVRTGAGLA